MQITQQYYKSLKNTGMINNHQYFKLHRIITIALLLIGVLAFVACQKHPGTGENAKPNIILIITDDQGFGDLGYYGNPNIKTPVLDSLAARSVRFDQFLVNPVCAPTRAAIMTGRYPMSAGVHDTYRGGAMMAAQEVTLAELLKTNNYATGMIGKWHLGDNYPMRPNDQGFDYTLNHLSGGIGQYGDWPNTLKRDSSYFNPILWENGKSIQTEGYCSDVFTQAAMDFVDKNKADPFFLYLSYNAPHGPLQLPQQYYEMYKNIDPDAGFEDRDMPFPKVTEHSKENARKVYGMITNIDDNLRRLFKHLDRLNIADNTLVIFMTDNGPQHPRYIAGMRGRKSSAFQGGIRVPSFWYYPKAFKEARDIRTPAAHYDILPTLAALTDTPIPDSLRLEGRSLLPLLTQEKAALPDRYINRYWTRSAPVRYKNVTTRKGDFKLVGMGKDTLDQDKFGLFNLAEDPYEQNDIALDHSAEVAELRSEMDTWLDRMDAEKHILNSPMPIIGTAFENPVRLNQNDAHFHKEEGVKKDFIYWDVKVNESKTFDFIIHLDKGLSADGQLDLLIGDRKETLEVKGDGQTKLVFEAIILEKGSTRIMPKLYVEREDELKYVYPFYLEIQDNSTD